MESLCNTASLNKFDFFAPIQQGTEKNLSCFALNAEQQYWIVQYLCIVKKISMTSNDLPLHLGPLSSLVNWTYL